jgi:pyridoxine 5-phosphate synthase
MTSSAASRRQCRSRRHLRNARGGPHPDPVRAALLAIAAGADGITAHLREDRRHIRDDDMARLKAEIDKPLNFEMAATAEMLASRWRPSRTRSAWCRSAARTHHRGRPRRGRPAQRAGKPFIAQAERRRDPGVAVHRRRPAADRDGRALRAPVIEIHTGAWCDAVSDGHAAKAEAEWQRIVAGRAGALAGLEVHAGHGLDYATAERSRRCRDRRTQYRLFHDGEALFVGLGETVRAMRAAMDRGRAKWEPVFERQGSHDHRHRLRPDRHPPASPR